MNKTKIEELYQSLGINCPFVLARELGVHVSHESGLGEIYGLYTPTSPKTLRIFINSSTELELQENVCHLLMEHHLMHPGIAKCLSSSDYQALRLSSVKRKLEEIKDRISFYRITKAAPF